MDRPLYIPAGRERFREPGGPAEWGTPLPLLHRSITDLKERELVEHVLNDPHQDMLFNIKGLETKDARILQDVPLHEFGRDLKGDVDILVIPRDHPELTTAIQVKRFEATVRMDAQGWDEVEGGGPERFRKLMAKGVKQANLTKAVGFGQVYLWIFVLIDTRPRNNGWYTYDGADSLLHSQIVQSISPLGLDPTIGLMDHDWCQAMDRPPFEFCSSGGHLQRLAQSTPQSPEITGRLRTLVSPIIRPR